MFILSQLFHVAFKPEAGCHDSSWAPLHRFLVSRASHSLLFPPPLHQRQADAGPKRQSNNPGQGAPPSMRLPERGGLTGGQLDLLERDHDGLAYGDHEAEDEGTLLLIATTGFVGPTGNEGRIATVATVHDEDGHPELVGDVPRSEDGVVEDHQTADDTANETATTKPVCDETRGDHEDEIDRANARRDIVDLRDGVPARRFQVDGEILHDVAAKCQANHRVCALRGQPYLPQVKVQNEYAAVNAYTCQEPKMRRSTVQSIFPVGLRPSSSIR